MRTLTEEEDMSEISTEAKNIKNLLAALFRYLEIEIEGMVKGKENINCLTT